jgi:hypothetical protein
MTEDPNKRHNDPKQTDEQPGEQQNIDDSSRKRPAQGGTDVERDLEREEQGGQRRAS